MKKTTIKLKKIQFGTSQRKMKSKIKATKTKLCVDKNGKACNKQKCGKFRCFYAHGIGELKVKNQYNIDLKYKEQKCNQYFCKRPNCYFYHDPSETRFNILTERLCQLEKQYDLTKNILQKNTPSKKKIPKKLTSNEIPLMRRVCVKRQVNVSPLIPILTQFDREDAIYLTQKLLDIIVSLNQQKNKGKQDKNTKNEKSEQKKIEDQNQINKVIMNLTQSNSILKDNQKYLFVQLLDTIPIILFKSSYFSYERNKFKGQVSYEVRTDSVVPYICQDMTNQKPRSLKLTIKSLNKSWESFIKIMETIQTCDDSLSKIEIDIQQFIGPKNVDDITKIFSQTLYSLKKVKVINLRVQFDYLENGEYERDIADSFLEMLQSISEVNPSLRFKLNIFRIVISYKNNSLEFSSEDVRRNTQKKRNLTNAMFRNSDLHSYFINKFQEVFQPKKIKYLTIDFSNLYLTQKKQTSVPHHKYDEEFKQILEGLQNVLDHLEDKCIEKLSMKFFGFAFSFENHDKIRRVYFKFQMNFQLYFQNTPIVAIKKFSTFSTSLHAKLNYKYKYSTYEGDIFTSKNKQKYKIPKQLDSKQKFRKLIVHKASEFLNLMTFNFENVMKIGYYTDDINHVQKILSKRQQLTHTVNINPPKTSQRHYRGYTFYIINLFLTNVSLDLCRRKFLYIYAKMKKIYSKNKSFFFRKEILTEIFDQIQLRVSDCNIITKYQFFYGDR